MLAVRKQVATMGKPPAKKQRQPLGTEGFLPPMASKTVELSVLKPQGMECSQQAHKQEVDLQQLCLQITQPWVKVSSDPKQRTLQSNAQASDSQKL